MFISFLPQHALHQLSGVSDLATSVLGVTSSFKITSTSTPIVTQQGLSRNVKHTLSPDRLDEFSKGIFISEIGWAIAICVAKCSILAFYWRLFTSQGRSFRITVWAFVALMIDWGILVVSVGPLINLYT